jgi:hypothetical protein
MHTRAIPSGGNDILRGVQDGRPGSYPSPILDNGKPESNGNSRAIRLRPACPRAHLAAVSESTLFGQIGILVVIAVTAGIAMYIDSTTSHSS